MSDSNPAPTSMTLTPELVTVVAVWCGGLVVNEIDPFDDTKRWPALNVDTPAGPKRASLGDIVIKHADGSFDVKKPPRVRPLAGPLKEMMEN